MDSKQRRTCLVQGVRECLMCWWKNVSVSVTSCSRGDFRINICGLFLYINKQAEREAQLTNCEIERLRTNTHEHKKYNTEVWPIFIVLRNMLWRISASCALCIFCHLGSVRAAHTISFQLIQFLLTVQSVLVYPSPVQGCTVWAMYWESGDNLWLETIFGPKNPKTKQNMWPPDCTLGCASFLTEMQMKCTLGCASFLTENGVQQPHAQRKPVPLCRNSLHTQLKAVQKNNTSQTDTGIMCTNCVGQFHIKYPLGRCDFVTSNNKAQLEPCVLKYKCQLYVFFLSHWWRYRNRISEYSFLIDLDYFMITDCHCDIETFWDLFEKLHVRVGHLCVSSTAYSLFYDHRLSLWRFDVLGCVWGVTCTCRSFYTMFIKHCLLSTFPSSGWDYM